MNWVVAARVSYAQNTVAGDYILRHLEETEAINYLGRRYSTLDILDYCLYNEVTFPKQLIARLPIDLQAAQSYFEYVRSYHEAISKRSSGLFDLSASVAQSV